MAPGEVEREAPLVTGETAGGQCQVKLSDAVAARAAAARAWGRGLRDGPSQAGPGSGGLGDEKTPAISRGDWPARCEGAGGMCVWGGWTRRMRI